MSSELLSIAQKLGELYKTRCGTQLAKWCLEKDIEEKIFEITPVGGWPGKNTEERKLAQEKVCAENQAYLSLLTDLDHCMEEMSETEGQIQALEAERRAREWDIRLMLIDALAGKNIQQNHQHTTPDNVFDDVLDDRSLGDFNPEFPAQDPNMSRYQPAGTTVDADIPF